MNLEEQINNEIKTAMKSKDKFKLEAYRAVKSAILIAKTEKGGSDIITPEIELKILQKQVKQRKDSAEIYKQQNRPELAEQELSEASAIEKFLQKKLSDEELTSIISKIIQDSGATTPADMGKVMGIATKSLDGKADGKEIASKVKQLLAK